MKFQILFCSNKTKKFIREFLNETDTEDFVEELLNQFLYDFYIYGYNPWDYLEETKLNMEYQGFIPVLKNETIHS